MKFWLALAALGAAAWWLFVRRPQAGPGQLGPVQPGFGQGLDAAVDWARDLVSSSQPLPPVKPPSLTDRAAAAGNRAIDAFGGQSEEIFTNLCGSAGGGKLCAVGAPVANLAGKATAAITVKSIEYGVKGVQKVGSLAVTGVKKLKFW